MKLSFTSTNYIKVSDIHTTNGATIASYTTVTASILNASTRVALTNASALTMTAVSGESNAYECNAPSTVSFTSVDEVIVQVTITFVIGVTTCVRTLEAPAIVPSRD